MSAMQISRDELIICLLAIGVLTIMLLHQLI